MSIAYELQAVRASLHDLATRLPALRCRLAQARATVSDESPTRKFRDEALGDLEALDGIIVAFDEHLADTEDVLRRHYAQTVAPPRRDWQAA